MVMRRTRTMLLAAVATGSLLAGCGSVAPPATGSADAGTAAPATSTADASAPAAPTAPASPTTRPAGVPAVLAFTAPLLGGGTLEGSTLAGKPVAFWFWAPT